MLTVVVRHALNVVSIYNNEEWSITKLTFKSIDIKNNRNIEITYSLADKWFDVGAGCCSDRKSNKLFAGDRKDLDTCKNDCLKNEKCKYVEYGWTDVWRGQVVNSQWCYVVSSDASCNPLDARPKPACGSGGNNGVHVYEYRPGMYTVF